VDDSRRVVVVGSGPAGAMAALSLLRSGIPVTLMESGGRFPGGQLARVADRTVYRRGPRLADHLNPVAADDPASTWVQVLQPGGLSNYWSGAVPRFEPDDFREGERLHERYRWPLSYDDLVPYYERVERVLGVVGGGAPAPGSSAQVLARSVALPDDWRPAAARARSLGQAFAPLPVAAGRAWTVAARSRPFNSFRLVQGLRRYPHFELLLGAHVLGLEWRSDRGAVTGVLYHDRAAGCERRLAVAAVVAAAGALSTTKLLLDSACADFPQGLGDTEGLLGRYLHEHVHGWSILRVEPAMARLAHLAHLTRRPVGDSSPLIAASCTVGPTSNLDRARSLLPGRSRSTGFGVNVFGTMVPRAGNRVRPHPTLKDEFGRPLAAVHLEYDAEERRNALTAGDGLVQVLESAGIAGGARWRPPELLVGSSVHYGGTVRMHRSPRHGMADGWGRLHAVPNVAIADASGFTTGPEKNPTLTAMALAARAAERLAGDLKALPDGCRR
jgi:choline dehydrogenase-like flavoprotein